MSFATLWHLRQCVRLPPGIDEIDPICMMHKKYWSSESSKDEQFKVSPLRIRHKIFQVCTEREFPWESRGFRSVKARFEEFQWSKFESVKNSKPWLSGDTAAAARHGRIIFSFSHLDQLKTAEAQILWLPPTGGWAKTWLCGFCAFDSVARLQQRQREACRLSLQGLRMAKNHLGAARFWFFHSSPTSSSSH